MRRAPLPAQAHRKRTATSRSRTLRPIGGLIHSLAVVFLLRSLTSSTLSLRCRRRLVRQGAGRVRLRRWGTSGAQSGSIQMDMPKEKRTKTDDLLEIGGAPYADREESMTPVSRTRR
jgi:hypothetical protein